MTFLFVYFLMGLITGFICMIIDNSVKPEIDIPILIYIVLGWPLLLFVFFPLIGTISLANRTRRKLGKKEYEL